MTPCATEPTTLKPHSHRPLDQGRLHSPTATSSNPVNVSSTAEPKEISDGDETKTLRVAEQSQVLQVEGNASATVPFEEGQPEISPMSATEAVGEERSGKTELSTGTGKDGSRCAGKTGDSSRTKRKRKTATRKRQHGESRWVCSSSGVYLRSCIIVHVCI